MLRQRLSESNPYVTNSKTHNVKKEYPIFSEWKLASAGLIFSLLLIAGKLYYNHYEEIDAFVLEKRLVTYQVLITDGEVVYKHAWKTVVKYSNVWLPLLCGICTTYFTWVMVYLDSNVPGVQPPSPFSPTRYKVMSGHTFHLNYLFAVMVGTLVFLYTHWKGISIEY